MSTKKDIKGTKQLFDQLMKDIQCLDETDHQFIIKNKFNNYLCFVLLDSDSVENFQNDKVKDLVRKYVDDHRNQFFNTISKIPAVEIPSIKEFVGIAELMNKFIKMKKYMDFNKNFTNSEIKEHIMLLLQVEEIPLAFVNLVKLKFYDEEDIETEIAELEKKIRQNGISKQQLYRYQFELKTLQKKNSTNTTKFSQKKIGHESEEKMMLHHLKEQNEFLISTSEKKNHQIASLQEINKKLLEKIAAEKLNSQLDDKEILQEELERIKQENEDYKKQLEQYKVENLVLQEKLASYLQEKQELETVIDELYEKNFTIEKQLALQSEKDVKRRTTKVKEILGVEEVKPMENKDFSTLEGLLKDKNALALLQEFSDEEFSGENVQFISDVINLRTIPTKEKKYKTNFDKIFNNYISLKAKTPITISTSCKESTIQKYKQKDPTTFDLAETEIMIFVREIFARFQSIPEWNSKLKQLEIEMIASTLPIPKKKSFFSNLIKMRSNSNTSSESTSRRDSVVSISDPSISDDSKELEENDETTSKESIESFMAYTDEEDLKDEPYIPEEIKIEKDESELSQAELLEKYISDGSLEKFKRFVEDRNIDLTTKIGKKSLIHVATLSGSYPIVEYFLQNGINVDVEDSNQRTCLHLAANIGKRDICILLLGSGAKVNSRDCYGFSPLLLLLKHHFFDLVKDFLLFGADLNFKRDNGMSALHDATLNADEIMYNWLIEQPNIKLNMKDQIGQTPFLRSVEKCSPEFIYKMMTTKSIDRNAIDSTGRNIFHLACRHRRDDFLEFLNQLNDETLKGFSNLILMKDTLRNQTPLHLAVESGKFKVVQQMILLILRLDEDHNIKDSHDKTPYDVACSKAEKAFSEYILSDNVELSLKEIQEKVEEVIQIRKFLEEVQKKTKKKKKK